MTHVVIIFQGKAQWKFSWHRFG